MHQIAPRLPGKTLVGVGAAFDLLSGTVPQAPPLLQWAGLEWAIRLWRRYVLNNPLYLVLAAYQLIRYRLGAAGTGRGLARPPST
jgi:N-acetylglucosaminyldiphosphoundecaprenol N-acetyl-beta-D-mannosaminyltransferase